MVTGFKLILNGFSHVHVASVPMAVTSGIYWGYFQGSARQEQNWKGASAGDGVCHNLELSPFLA